MKRLLLALALALPTCCLLAQHIAIVDMERVLANHPNTPNDRKTLETTLATYTEERDKLRADIERQAADLEKQVQEARNPMIAPAKAEELRKAAEAAAKALDEAQRLAESRMAERSRTLTEMERSFVNRTSMEIQKTIGAYAKEKGLDLVLYANVVPYAKDGLDITDAIITRCGGTPPKRDTAKDGAALPPPATLKAPALPPADEPAK